MKKISSLFVFSLLLSQSLHAGKDFFNYSENSGILYFKKSGKYFEKAKEATGKFAMNHRVHQVSFHEKVSREQRGQVISSICSTAHLYHLGSGFFEDEKIHYYNETLKKIIEENTVCMKNEYIMRWENLPKLIQDHAINELIREFQKNTTHGQDKTTLEINICQDNYQYTCGIYYNEIQKRLPASPFPLEEKELSISNAPEREREKEKASKLPNDFEILKETIEESKSFFSFGSERRKQGEVRNSFKITEFSQEIQKSLLSSIQEKILAIKNVKGRKERPFIEVEFKPAGSNLIYNCMLDSYVVKKYKKYLALGPLVNVSDSIFESEDNNISSLRSFDHFGDVVISPSLLPNILLDSIEEGMSVLEIGSARGVGTFQMLSRGAKVTAIDISERELEKLKLYTPIELQKNLRIIRAKFPTELNLESEFNKFDIIYMSHVAHYLTGEEFREGIQKIASLLEPHKGRLYFQALTPYSKPYAWRMIKADTILAQVENNQRNDEWPGFFDEAEKISEHEQRPNAVGLNHGNMPGFGHPIHPSILERELKRAQFNIRYIGYNSVENSFSQKLSPLSYQEQEASLKSYVFPLSLEQHDEMSKNISNLSSIHIPWLSAHEYDRRAYHYNFSNPMTPTAPLITMSLVLAIASLGVDDDLYLKE